MTTPDPMAEIRASFFVECEELLEALQDGLHCMDTGTDDSETTSIRATNEGSPNTSLVVGIQGLCLDSWYAQWVKGCLANCLVAFVEVLIGFYVARHQVVANSVVH